MLCDMSCDTAVVIACSVPEDSLLVSSAGAGGCEDGRRWGCEEGRRRGCEEGRKGGCEDSECERERHS